MSERSLSSTELISLLKSSRFEHFKEKVEAHFAQNRTDHVSGLKLSRTIASFAYGKESQTEQFTEVVENFRRANAIVTENTPASELTDNLLKELYICSIHVLNRLIKLKQLPAVSTFWPEFFRLSSKLRDSSLVQGRAYSLYAELWNFSVEREPSSTEERVCLIEVARGALEFLLVLEKTERFTVSKFIDKVTWLSRSSVNKDPSMAVIEEVALIVTELSSKLSDKSRHEDFALLLFEIFFCFAPKSLAVGLSHVKVILGPGGRKVLELMELLAKVQTGESLGSVKWSPGRLSERARAVLLPLYKRAVSSVSSSRCSTHPDSVLDLAEAVLSSLQEVGPGPVVLDIQEKMSYLLSSLVKHNQEAADRKRTRDLTARIFSSHLQTLEEEAEEVKEARWSVLSAYSYNTAASFYNRKQYEASEELFLVSVQSGRRLVLLEPGQAGALRTRLKLLADVKFRMKQYEAALRTLAEACALTVSKETEDQTVRRILAELGGLWVSYKVSWLVSGGEKVHDTNVLSLLVEEERWVVEVVARTEVTWYRRQHQSGADLTQSWVNIMAALLRVTRQETDKALVLLEQTWVYWLGDNAEDLELGARCAEKAVSLLGGHYLESLAWFWRFQCEHRLLSIQVTAEVERVSKEKEPVRREVPGLGEEVKAREPTPAFPGLELSVQLRLVEMLETAVKIWRTRRFSPSEWFSAKTICQFQLSAAFSLQLLGHSDLAESVFRTVLETARDNDAWEEEALLAQVELAEVGEEVDLVQVLELGEALSEKKAGSVSHQLSHLSGLVLGSDLVRRDRVGAAEELLHQVIDHDQLRMNKMFNILTRCKAALRLSQLKLNISSRSRSQPGPGPLETAHRCWQWSRLCRAWWEDDIREPAKQDPHLVWLGPCLAQLHLASLLNLSAMFRLCSAPRELKCYLKTGLKFAQERCLPLRVAELLVEMAQFSLLCDDEVGAEVHLAGTEFILSTVLRDRTAVKVSRNIFDFFCKYFLFPGEVRRNSRVVSQPGQDDLSMSPNLIRHNNNPPPYLHHPNTCPCHLCHLPLLHSTLLGLLFSQAWSLVLKEDLSSALGLYSTAQQVHSLARTKVTGAERERLDQVQLRHLGQEGECLAWSRLWPEYDEMWSQVESLLGSSQHWMEAHPSLYVMCLGQRQSVLMLREKQALVDMMREKEVMVDQMSSLSCSRDETKVTPVVSRKTADRIAPPKKQPVPSLGVGDPDKLAKKLEESLSLAANEEDSPPLSQQKPVVRRTVPRKPKFSSEPLTQKKVPTIVVEEETPRRFFKSKGPLLTPSVKTSSVKKSEVQSDQFKTPARSLKSLSNIECFVDVPSGKTPTPTPTPASTKRSGRGQQESSENKELGTPARAPASIRIPGSRTRSARKSSREDQVQETEVSESEVRKSSRKKKLDLEKPTLATRSSTRLKRI